MIDIKSQIIKPALDLEDLKVVTSAEGWKLTDLRSLGFFLKRNFKYRRRITITEQSGSDLTDYQVLIELSSSNFNFEHAQTNGEDVRFTDANGNLLDYWIEEWDAVNETAKIWVEVPSIPANSEIEIFMYYGNPTVASASDADATFVFFDDFEEYPVGSHPTKWADADMGAGITEVTDVMSYRGTKCLLQNANGSGNGARATKIADGGAWGNVAISSMYYDKGGMNAVAVGTYEPADDPTSWGNEWLYLKHNLENYVYRENSDGVNTGNVDTDIPRKVNQWVKFEFRYYNGELRAYIDGQLAHTTTKIDNIGRILLLDWWASTDDDYHDLVIVRKYTEPEPSVSISEEESA
mgnify:CR=1 FL=1